MAKMPVVLKRPAWWPTPAKKEKYTTNKYAEKCRKDGGDSFHTKLRRRKNNTKLYTPEAISFAFSIISGKSLVFLTRQKQKIKKVPTHAARFSLSSSLPVSRAGRKGI